TIPHFSPMHIRTASDENLLWQALHVIFGSIFNFIICSVKLIIAKFFGRVFPVGSRVTILQFGQITLQLQIVCFEFY
ncbi:hypothetical protein PMAYCL1PPCAC_09302, partial [Pristionchus mayeri]